MRVSVGIVLIALVGACAPSLEPAKTYSSESRAINASAPTLATSQITKYGPLEQSVLMENIRADVLEKQVLAIQRKGNDAKGVAEKLGKIARTDAEKAWVIYRWITENIAYDASAFFSGKLQDVDTEITLRRGNAVCGGYARLYTTMARHLGLGVFEISGYARGYGSLPKDKMTTNHAWNAVRIDGRWYIVDSTWGSGSLSSETRSFEKQYKPFYFAANPHEIVYSHFPERGEYQFLAKPVDAQSFANQAKYNQNFFAAELRPITPITAVQQVEGAFDYRFYVPEHRFITATVQEFSGKKATIPTLVSKKGTETRVLVHFPRKGRYQVQLFTNDEGTRYAGAAEWQVENSKGFGSILPNTFDTYRKRQVILMSPLESVLEKGKEYTFRIKVPKALQVAAVVDGEWEYFEEKDGVFEATLKGDSYSIFAKYVEGENFKGLVEYQ